MLAIAVLLMFSNALTSSPSKIPTNVPTFDWAQCYAESCYHKAQYPMLWTEADNFCEELGAELASVHSTEENTFLYYLCGSEDSCWLGFSDAEVEGVWEWSDGSNVDYTNWGDGEPNDHWHEDYALLSGPHGRWNDMTDSTANTYAICEKNAAVSTFDSSPCYGNSCYFKTPSQMTWDEANTTCLGLGAELASVHSLEENTYLYILCGTESSCWHGFTDAAVEGKWEWSDGSNVEFTNWENGEPNNNFNEDYAAIEGETSQWNDWGGNYDAYAICQKSDTIPAIVWSECYGNSCYYKTPSEMSWIEANMTCVGLGVELASVHSDEESTFLFHFCGYDSDCWIGLTDEQDEGRWKWTDGGDFDYENWGSGQPNDHWNQDYVIFDPSKNGQWNDKGNSWQAHAICMKAAPTPTPTSDPTNYPTKLPTSMPTLSPSALPTNNPTIAPTNSPTFYPTKYPTSYPTYMPSSDPTLTPTSDPTNYPTELPTYMPTLSPSALPTEYPTIVPTNSPTFYPTMYPTSYPTFMPSSDPTSTPTSDPTNYPTELPTSMPTLSPSALPTENPTIVPTNSPTFYPTMYPTSYPTVMPSSDPTPTPTSDPTNYPTKLPTSMPTISPSASPTDNPTIDPTNSPTLYPTKYPTSYPTYMPSSDPTSTPTSEPTNYPTKYPTHMPTLSPSAFPTSNPTIDPSTSPTLYPTKYPTSYPTYLPSSDPTSKPTNYPTKLPTYMPTLLPSAFPTNNPTIDPTNSPTFDWSQCYAGSCYHKAQSPMSWTEADNFCEDLGAELASVHSTEENTFLYYLCGSEDAC
jgi:hypothetical protein